MNEKRTYNTVVREPWNPVIHTLLKAVDCHMALFMKRGDPFHARKAQLLREYVSELKTWIHEEEERVRSGVGRADESLTRMDQGRLES